MLNFEEELQKFRPVMEVDEIEEALYRENQNLIRGQEEDSARADRQDQSRRN